MQCKYCYFTSGMFLPGSCLDWRHRREKERERERERGKRTPAMQIQSHENKVKHFIITTVITSIIRDRKRDCNETSTTDTCTLRSIIRHTQEYLLNTCSRRGIIHQSLLSTGPLTVSVLIRSEFNVSEESTFCIHYSSLIADCCLFVLSA